MKNPVFLVRHMYPAMKVRENVERRAKPAVRPRKFVTHKKHTELGKNKLISEIVQWILIYKTKSFCFLKMVIDET